MEKDVELEGIPKEDLLNMKKQIENKIELPNLNGEYYFRGLQFRFT